MRTYSFLKYSGTKNCKNLFFLYLVKKQPFFKKFIKISPIFASIKLTETCNSNCITCNTEKNYQPGHELNTEEIGNIMGQLFESGIRFIRFTGGEPLLKKNIDHLIQEARQIGFKGIYIATNGLLLEQKAEKLKKASHITVSLDGIGPANDAIRGVPGDYKRSIRGIQRIRRINPKAKLEIATTLLNLNLEQIGDIISFCRKIEANWFVNLFDTRPYYLQGIETSHLEPQDPENINKAIKTIRYYYNRHPEIFSFQKAQIDYLQSFLLQGIYPKYCILGFTNIDIASNGDIYSGCWAMQPMGNIRMENLQTILSRESYMHRALLMLHRRCPQCTCGWMINNMYENL